MPVPQKKAQKGQHTQRVTPAVQRTTSSHGLKQPGDKLRRLIELVDLVPPDVDLEGLLDDVVRVRQDLLLDYLSSLPPALQTYLLQLMNRPKQWPPGLDPEKLHAESVELAAAGEDGWTVTTLEDARLFCQNSAVVGAYNLIYRARELFRKIAREGARTVNIQMPAELPVRIDGKGRAFIKTDEDPLVSAIVGEEIAYIRECPKCKRIFFAGRFTQNAWPKSCADALRQKQRRDAKKDLAAGKARAKARKRKAK